MYCMRFCIGALRGLWRRGVSMSQSRASYRERAGNPADDIALPKNKLFPHIYIRPRLDHRRRRPFLLAHFIRGGRRREALQSGWKRLG